MTALALDIARLVDMLPESDQKFAHELIKKLVLAWDPDFTKTTPEEAAQIENAKESGFVRDEQINWDNLKPYGQ